MRHRVQVSSSNWNSKGLCFVWDSPKFTPEDGFGTLSSLFEIGDCVVAIAGTSEERTIFLGSGVMVGPGLLLTATHVLREANRDGQGPVMLTFLPTGGARVWLPYETSTASAPGDIVLLTSSAQRQTSDISLVSCVLSSESRDEFPLRMASLEIDLPLPGERLWAVGFRQGDIDDDSNGIIPLVSSGLVTASYPHGRDRQLRSACVEVAMETLGGMSGGPVFNDAGNVVGVVSSSFESDDNMGPTYVTMMWEAMRIEVGAPWPRGLWPDAEADLFKGRELDVTKIEGHAKRDGDGNVTFTMRTPVMELLVAIAKEGPPRW